MLYFLNTTNYYFYEKTDFITHCFVLKLQFNLYKYGLTLIGVVNK